MKCRRVEKLIPLYVEGDLTSAVTSQITSHLEWCGRCNWLADEYKESQSWLRSPDTPEFDEASLNAMKAGVLSRIEATGAKPSLLASFVQQWRPRQVFALSAAALLIFAVVALYIYQSSTSTKPFGDAEIAKQVPPEPGVASQQTPRPGPEKAPGAGLKDLPEKRNNGAKPRSGRRQVTERKLDRPLLSQRTIEPVIEISAPQDDLPEMLRIEIQTSDPNIRIIWFAPKEVEGPQTEQ